MATYAECLSLVVEMVTPHIESGAEPTEDASLTGDLGLSSIKMLELVADVEDRLDISLPLNDMPNVHTVRDFAQLLESVASASD